MPENYLDRGVVVGRPDDVTAYLRAGAGLARRSASPPVNQPCVGAATLSTRLPLHRHQLTELAPAGSSVYAVAHWRGRVGVDGWFAVHEGQATQLSVPGDVTLSLTVTGGGRLYLPNLWTGPLARMGKGALIGALVDSPAFSPAGIARPATVLIDADLGVAVPGNDVAAPWWSSDLTFDGDAITGTPVGLGRMLRDRANPDAHVRAGGWRPWAWDALEAYARHSGANVDELAQALLCAAASSGLPTFDDARELATITADPVDVLAAARTLAEQRLTSSALLSALRGIFA